MCVCVCVCVCAYSFYLNKLFILLKEIIMIIKTHITLVRTRKSSSPSPFRIMAGSVQAWPKAMNL